MQTCLDALIISDIHLGSDNCQAKDLVVFLEQIRCGVIQTSRIILNGDVFDSFDFRRLKKIIGRCFHSLESFPITLT